MLAVRGDGQHKPHRSKHHYALRGLMICGICSRRMQGRWANAAPYYRCSFPSQYGLANHVQHPRNVTLRQDAVLPARSTSGSPTSSGSSHLAATIEELTAASARPAAHDDGRDDAAARVAECDRKLAGYRAALDAGGDPATISRWTTEITAERARYTARARPAATQARMTRDQIGRRRHRARGHPGRAQGRHPADKAEIYTQLSLRLTCQPGRRIVRAEGRLDQTPH
jgi:site-specific DNA recombinase